jgi:hypothetical protein
MHGLPDTTLGKIKNIGQTYKGFSSLVAKADFFVTFTLGRSDCVAQLDQFAFDLAIPPAIFSGQTQHRNLPRADCLKLPDAVVREAAPPALTPPQIDFGSAGPL